MLTRGCLKSRTKGGKGANEKSNRGVMGDQGASGGDGRNPEVLIAEETAEGRTCKTCEGPDTKEMVQCNQCDGWFHFHCVGVSEEVVDKSWSCTNCVTAKWVQRTKTTLEGNITHGEQDRDRRSTRSHPVGNIATSTRSNPVIFPSPLPKRPASITYGYENSRQVDHSNVGAERSGVDQEKQSSFPAGANIGADRSKVDQEKQQSSLPAGANLGVEIPNEKALSEISVSSSKKSAVQRAKLQLMRLEEERQFQQQQEDRRRDAEERAAQEYREFLDKKYRLLEEVVSNKSSRSQSETSSRVNDWVQIASRVQQTEPEAEGIQNENLLIPSGNFTPPQAPGEFGQQRIRFEPSAQTRSANNVPIGQQFNHRLPSLQFRSAAQSSHSQFTSYQGVLPPQIRQLGCPDGRTTRHPFQPNSAPAQLSQPLFNSTYVDGPISAPPACSTGVHHQNCRGSVCASQGTFRDEYQDEFQLSRSQVAARQAVPRDLPTFSGNPEEWPIFLSMYNRTTTMCGFTEEENLIRLQKSLKGKAYEAVKSRLMFPGNITGILGTLKMLFGQPEIIIQSLIEKVSSLPSIREGKLDSLVDFAVHVQNFCATVDGCGLQEYMYNISLLHQLVSKLPPSLKLNWAQHRLTVPTVNLATFSTWIYALAEAASVVTFASAEQSEKSSRSESRGPKKGNAYLNAHSELDSESSSSEESKKVMPKEHPAAKPTTHACPICKGTCRSADKCKRFLELSRDSRWATIREFGFCRTCLRMHKGSCNGKPCGKNGCTFRHHELLHNDSKEQSQNAIASTGPESTSPALPLQSLSGCNSHQTAAGSVLFRYLPVVLYGKKDAVQTYAFLDEGSELTLLDQELADKLELDGAEHPLCLRWTGGTERCEPNSRTYNFQIAGIREGSKRFDLNDVRTVNDLMLPPQSLDMAALSRKHPHLRDLPIDSYRDIRPRILIGTKHAHLGLVMKSKEGEFGQPIAVKSRLGWTICGGGSSRGTSLHHYSFHICPCHQTSSNDDLHQAMKNYFSLDSLGVTKTDKLLLPVEDQRALSLLQSLTNRKDDRYESGLL